MFKATAKGMAANIRPETELLLSCARTHMDSERTKRVKALLQKTLDWNYLIQTTFLHGVTPLLYRNLSTTFSEAVPGHVLNKLRHRFRLTTLSNLVLTKELLRLLRMLEEHDIPAIPYKGPVLATSVYGNLALRQFKDLDILVPEQDATRAKDLLLSNGYDRTSEAAGAGEAAFDHFRRVYELVRQDNQVLVELHWSITSWTFFFPLNPKHLWQRLETVSLAGTPIRSLMTEDLLLILSVHGAKHHWRRLRWICDIAEVLRHHHAIDWSWLMEQASTLGGVRMVYLGLLLAQDLLDASVPENVMRHIEGEPKVRSLAAKVKSRLFTENNTMAVEQPEFYVQLRERPRDRMRCRLYLGYRMMAPRMQSWTLRLAHTGRSVLQLIRQPATLVGK